MPKGAEASPDLKNIRSGETYLGYKRATNFASPENLQADAAARAIRSPNRASTNGAFPEPGPSAPEQATLNQPDGGIAYRFSARDLHLVLGPGASGKPVRFRVTIDGKAPGADHGADTDADGNGTVTSTRLYQLVRQSGDVEARNFEIRFLDPGVRSLRLHLRLNQSSLLPISNQRS